MRVCGGFAEVLSHRVPFFAAILRNGGRDSSKTRDNMTNEKSEEAFSPDTGSKRVRGRIAYRLCDENLAKGAFR